MEAISSIMDRVYACRHTEAYLARYVTSTDDRICYWCPACRHIVSKEKGFTGQWIALDHPELEEINTDHLPVVNCTVLWRRCEGPCQQITRTELHHTAPSALFGEAAEQWPAFHLCRSCHERWHRILTPGLCTAYDADQHVTLLRRTLKRPQLEALLYALQSAVRSDADGTHSHSQTRVLGR
jgi:hypothetical protein